MCGIAGIIYHDSSRRIANAEIKKMTDAIINRGPDDEGFFIHNNIGLGFRRLSIIDLTSGHQPMSANDEKVWIIFNGEIYNFLEKRDELIKKGHVFHTKCDTEVVLHLYLEYGQKCTEHLRGMFAFSILDLRSNVLFCSRDRMGIKPFFYYQDNEKIIWASEIKAIKAVEGVALSLDYKALDDYLAFGSVLGNKTIYKQISKLEPAHQFLYRLGTSKPVVPEKYWELHYQPDYSKSEAELLHELDAEMRHAVNQHLISDVSLGAFLSGGIDSGLVVSYMAENTSNPINTFTVGFEGGINTDIVYAKQVSEKYHTSHNEMIVTPQSIDILHQLISTYDEPFYDSSAIPTYLISKFAREKVTVVLTGDGGDEIFAGYRSYKKFLEMANGKHNSALTRKLLWENLYKVYPNNLFGKGTLFYKTKDPNNVFAYASIWNHYERDRLYRPEIKSMLGDYHAESGKVSFLKNIDNPDALSKMQRLDIQTYLVNDILTKVDRASMNNSLEARVPFLDHKIVEMAFRIPSEYKIVDGQSKAILKKLAADRLTPDLLKQKKKGFGIPLAEWFKNDIKQLKHDAIVSGKSSLGEYLNIKSILPYLSSEGRWERDHSYKIWTLIYLNLWLEKNNL